jgi:anti-sigma regulatory factor (Ser/Thr protein kinase)
LIPVLIDHLENQVQRLERCNLRALAPVKLALHEALTNAILHGNLELSSELRETDEQEYFRLAAERQVKAPYADRRVIVTARVSTEEMSFVIRDEGNGFDVNILPDPTDPENLTRASGRGILLIRTFMDRVEFNSRGNEITLVRRCPT